MRSYLAFRAPFVVVDKRGADSSDAQAQGGIGRVKDAAAALRDLTIVFGVFVYYAGFIYLHGFYDNISVDSTAVDLAPVVILGNAFGPIWSNRYLLLLVLLGIGVAFLALQYARSREGALQPTLNSVFFDLAASLVASALLTHVVFGFSNAQGRRTAIHARAGISTDKIWFVFKKADDGRRLGSRFLDMNQSHKLLLAAETKDFYIVIGPAPDKQCDRVPKQSVFRLAKTDVLLSETEIPRQVANPTPIPRSPASAAPTLCPY